MALKIGDRVRENTSSTGVGGLSLTGAPAGFQRFSAVLASGDVTYYSLEENDKFEVGIGTYGSNNLERTTVLSSSNSGDKISLGGSGVVFITYPADKALFTDVNDQFVLGASGLLFANGTTVKEAKLVELTDVNLSGTPTQDTVFDLNITNKSLSLGDMTGATNTNNVLIGFGAASGITNAQHNVVIGSESSGMNKTGSRNVYVGSNSGPSSTSASTSTYESVAVGCDAGNLIRQQSTVMGYSAGGSSYEVGFTAVGYQAGTNVGSHSTIVGYQAGTNLTEDYSVCLGYRAGYNAAGSSSVWIGRGAGTSSSSSTNTIAIGFDAGKSSSATSSIYIGKSAGESNAEDDTVFIGNASPSSNGTLIKGDMANKRVAIGAADVTLDDTLFVGINSQNDEGIVVKSAVSQSSNLTSWKDSSEAILAAVSPDGIVSANTIHATGNGVLIDVSTPASTSNRLYNVGSSLFWNGAPLSVDAVSVSGIANYASGQAVQNQVDIAYVSGVAAAGGDVTTAQLNYVSGVATYSSGVLTGGTPTFDDINVASQIFHDGDADTYIKFAGADEIQFFAGGKNMLMLDEAANDKVVVNDDGLNINFRVESNNEENLLFTDGANDKVGIGTSSPSYLLDVAGMAQTTGAIVGNSGIVLANNTPSVTTNTLYNDGGTLKFNGSTIGGVDTYTSGVATYASGQAIENETDISYVSGIAVYASGNSGGGGGDVTTAQLNYVSGIAVYGSGVGAYASGQAIENEAAIATNVSNISTNTSNISTNTSNISTNSGRITYASGQAIQNEIDIAYVSGAAVYASGSVHDHDYVSGVAAYASGNTITTQAIANYASGQAIANETDIATNTSNISTNTSNISTNTARVSYASGQAIANESDIVAVSGIATKTFTVTAADSSNYTIDGMGLNSDTDPTIYLHKGHTYYFNKQTASHPFRISTSNGGSAYQDADGNSIEISGQGVLKFEVPQDAPDKLYYYCTSHAAMNGVIYTTNNIDEVIHVSGIAAYASGQAISNQSSIGTNASNISTNTSNISTNTARVNYASGQAIENESDIVATSGIANYASGQAISNKGNITALLSASGTATSLIASSGIANYASGQAVSNQASITTNANNITYVSGVATNKFTVTAADSSNYTIDGMGLNNGLDPDLYLHKGHTYYFDKQTSSHPFRVSTSNGGSAYQDADGNSIEISGQGVLKFEVPQNAPDKLYYYCTSHAAMNGVIYTTNNVDEIIHVSGIAAYASGQAVSNQSNVTALLAASGTATSLIASSGIASYASGQAIANESDIVAVSGIAAYASGVSGAGGSITVKEADGSPNVGNVTTIVVSNGTLTDNGGGQVTVTTGGGGGGGDVTTAQLNYVSGVAVYSSGQAIANEADILYVSGVAAAGGGTSLTAGSGVVVDGANKINIHSGTGNFQEIQLNSANTFTPKMVFTGSGVQDTPIRLKVLSNQPTPSTSGTALSFEGTEGQLFGITDNLSSGNIFSVNDITGLPLISADASGDVKIGQFGRYVGIGSGIPEYGLDVSASGRIQKGVVLSSYVPAVTTNTLYNEGGTLKFNGSAVGGGGGDVSTAQLNYVSGIAVYSSGQTISNQGNITALLSASGTATSLIASSGIASYASGQAISNQGNITALLSASGTATSLIASSGIASYASGQAIENENDLVAVSGIAAYASGISLTVKEADGSPNVSNVRTIVVSNGTLTDDGAGQVTVTTGGGGGGSSLTAGSGIIVDGSDRINIHGGTGNLQELQITSDNVFVPKLTFTGSGVADTPINLEVASSFESVSTSGSALLFQGTQGQLFSITDNLSSGVIFNVSDITGLPLIEADASGDVKLGEFGRYVGIGTGVPLYGFDVSSSGQLQKGVILSDYVPATTTNALYNEGGTLKFNGSAIGGGGGGVDAYTSGVATYASGNTIATQNIAEYASGSAAYASGQLISTQSVDFTAGDGLTGGGTLASDRTFAVGAGNLIDVQADQVDVDLTEAAAATIAHGDNLIFLDGGAAGAASKGSTDDLAALLAGDGLTKSNSVMAVNVDDSTIETNSDAIRVKDNGITLAKMAGLARGKIIYGDSNGDPAALALGGANQVLTSDGTDIAWADNVNTYLSGVAAYSSGNTIINDGLVAYASGNTANIAFGSNAEGDILIHDGSKFTRLARGTDNYILKMNGNLPNWEAESGGGGSSLTAGSGITIDGADRINVHGGSGHFINLDVEGAFTATTKSFLIDHPSKEGKKLQYASLEGPENGVYVRGTTKEGFITLPDYWRDLVHTNSITVTLTPVGSFQPLFVESKNNREIIVGGVCGYYDYVVWGERKDVERLEVEW